MINKSINIQSLVVGPIISFFFIVVIFLLINHVQESQLAENTYVNETIQKTKETFSIFTNGYFLAGIAVSAIMLISLVIYLYNRASY